MSLKKVFDEPGERKYILTTPNGEPTLFEYFHGVWSVGGIEVPGHTVETLIKQIETLNNQIGTLTGLLTDALDTDLVGADSKTLIKANALLIEAKNLLEIQ